MMLCCLALLALLCMCVLGEVQPATLTDQAYNYPQSPLPSTPGILPRFNVPLPPDASNLVDLTFGSSLPSSTIQSVDQLGNVCYFYDLFGNPSDTRSAPVDGIPNNFRGIYSFYNEFLPNSTVRNPLAVHQVLEDRLRLVARTKMNGSAPGADYEIGYIRLPTQFKPGMLVELTLSPGGWPTNRWSWPTFWAFSGVMLQGPPKNVTRYYGDPPLEIDGFDGFPKDNSTQGLSIPNGAIPYAPASDYDYPYDIYMQSTGLFRYENTRGVSRLDTTPESIPTDPNNPGLTVCIDWTDMDTIKWIYNGEVSRIHHVHYPTQYSNGSKNWDGAPPPPELIGQPLPMFIMVSHQFGVNFNPIDGKALDQYNGSIFAAYDIQSIRVWDRPSTLYPPSSTPSPGPLPPPQTGPSLGDLPPLTSGTYVLNVEAVDGKVIDHFGCTVTLMGDAYLGNDTINGLPATNLQFSGGISEVMGGISVQGPAVYWAQGTSNVYLFQVASNQELSNWWNSATWAQFIQACPSAEWNLNKTTLWMTSLRGFEAQLLTNGSGNSTSSSAPWIVNENEAILGTLFQTIENGTVKVQVGYGNVTLPSTGGVDVDHITGYTELLIGAGRDNLGMLSTGAQFLHGQTLMVATPLGTTLAPQDLAVIQAYFAKKWGAKLDSQPSFPKHKLPIHIN